MTSHPDPARNLRRLRNVLLAVIGVLTLLALVGSCAVDVARSGLLGQSAKSYIEANYQRSPGLDEPSVRAYVADESVWAVAAAITGAEEPIDARSGDTQAGNIVGTRFLQYSDYLVGLFPNGPTGTRVMLELGLHQRVPPLPPLRRRILGADTRLLRSRERLPRGRRQRRQVASDPLDPEGHHDRLLREHPGGRGVLRRRHRGDGRRVRRPRRPHAGAPPHPGLG
ncbi:DUF4247 domain-containing protein [Gordonia sp. (in: high G+C Gram-positive bacteria)]|uniref:DUF4247 domain-containing protein n=1 Tax=Gordonia sp. (in: high G+C Gram-positive bacteria) TaxID=84139 RepID=UPI0039E347D3